MSFISKQKFRDLLFSHAETKEHVATSLENQITSRYRREIKGFYSPPPATKPPEKVREVENTINAHVSFNLACQESRNAVCFSIFCQTKF